ncbi:bacillithiol system redox-active protein YtxJ [Pseudogracilibacillus auburnensis]|uniref:Bacillithiol system protein YtxJ n=1 Tax=Pseudogracilibacillus auburnensis TaxID=1494959 RepID=A0A2V3VX89_9BACI|nr:bacillithiol system redox-active protein YtxJ [Pseudogracilibacillus auburnensis]MBO1004648.1 bacillithiol system redox-active protein YtxJ [Pseudogracilibacillus auburnensis]PXW85554.1 bacillithiol system protein YtxJ [Pseudogracilibacillus auburnensis]
MALKELVEIDDLTEVWEASREKPVLLFKQSTTCPISADAFDQFNTFLQEDGGKIDAFFVKVRESRPVSDQIAEDLGIRHQSPQLFVVKNKEAAWNASHTKITVDSIKEALQNA